MQKEVQSINIDIDIELWAIAVVVTRELRIKLNASNAVTVVQSGLGPRINDGVVELKVKKCMERDVI